MNKTAIEWCDYTWNPVTGCNHGCKYCYARKIAERFKGSKAWPQGFEPMLHRHRLMEPQKKKMPQSIFVCSMADLFGSWVSDEWIKSVMNMCACAPEHQYIFLTKNPQRYLTIPGEFIRENRWFGTSVTNAMDAGQRIHWLQRLPEGNTFISFEPLHGNPAPLDLTGIKQVIIGAQTNPSIEPDHFWISEIMQEADRTGAKVFCKDSLARIPEIEFRRELCWRIHK